MKYSIIALVALSVLLLYFIYNPSDYHWMPKCSFKMLTGYSCPGCGAQRAFHAALHGDFAGALHYNFFLVVALPYLILAIIARYIPGKVGEWVDSRLLTMTSGWIYIVLFCIWWIVRNIFNI